MPNVEKLRTGARWLAAIGFAGAGLYHFINPAFYLGVIPDILPAPTFWNALAGAAEIAGGVGLLVPKLRRAAAVGLIVMLIGFLWVHVEMIVAPQPTPMTQNIPRWVIWLRLPFQAVFIALVYWVGLTGPKPNAQPKNASNESKGSSFSA